MDREEAQLSDEEQRDGREYDQEPDGNDEDEGHRVEGMVADSLTAGAGMSHVDSLSPSLFLGAVIVVLIGWSWLFHFWSNSPSARRSRSPLWLGFTATAGSALFLIAGIIGFDLSKRSRFFTGTAWTEGVIWRQVVVGLVLVPVAIYLLRRGVRDIKRRLSRI